MPTTPHFKQTEFFATQRCEKSALETRPKLAHGLGCAWSLFNQA
jgi:hypothetical protein